MISMLCGAELDIFVPSFPEIQAQFNLSPFMTQLTLSLNFIAYCICSLFVGIMSDKYDRRKIVMISLLIFIVGSVFCLFTYSYYVLLIGRVLQGIGIAGPSLITYAIIADKYPIEKQISFIGLLHGLTAFAMSAAPIIGSYITHYFGWRGNFVLLLLFSLICLLLSTFFIHSNNQKLHINISLTSYIPLIKSKKLMLFTAAISFFAVPFWVFVGISPILYRQDFQVSLENFGFYQGALAMVFAIGSSLSGILIKKVGTKKAFFIGLAMCFIHIIAICFIIILNVKDPLIITLSMAIASAGVVIPINTLYPHSLEVLENSKGRASAFISGMRLMICSIGLWLVGASYDGTFAPIGYWIIITMSIALIISIIIIRTQKDLLAPLHNT